MNRPQVESTMRVILAVLILAAAVWRAGVDWQATIGQGYAFRLGTIGSLISKHWPEQYGHLVEALKHSGVPFAWNPVGAILMSLPLALLLAAIAGTVWLTRPREGDGRRVR